MTKNKNAKSKMTKHTAQYYGVALPAPPILSALTTTFSAQSSDTSSFYSQLTSTSRVQTSFHVTLIYTTDSQTNPDIWSYYQNLLNSNGDQQTNVDVALQSVVWDDRVMAIAVNVTESGTDGGSLPSADAWMHVTVGTVDRSVKPVESNDLLQRWHDGEDGIQSVEVGNGGTVVGGVIRAF